MERVPYWRKCLLTIREAALYSDRSVEEIMDLVSEKRHSFVLYVDKRKQVLIKRESFKQYLCKEAEKEEMKKYKEGGEYYG